MAGTGRACLGLAPLPGAARFPIAAVVLWIFTIEATPDLWFSGAHETMLGVEKGVGIMLVILLGLRFGWRRDRYNPGFAFAAMFIAGLLHGLYPGLTMLSSLRSLIGSAAPFAFGFIRIPPNFRQAVTPQRDAWAAGQQSPPGQSSTCCICMPSR